MFPPSEKLSHTKIYASGSGRHHRCPIFFFPRGKLFPLENLLLLFCALLTHELFAIAKFLRSLGILLGFLSPLVNKISCVCRLTDRQKDGLTSVVFSALPVGREHNNAML